MKDVCHVEKSMVALFSTVFELLLRYHLIARVTVPNRIKSQVLRKLIKLLGENGGKNVVFHEINFLW